MLADQKATDSHRRQTTAAMTALYMQVTPIFLPVADNSIPSAYWSWLNSTMTDGNVTLPPPARPSPSLTDILKLYPAYRASLELGVWGCGVLLALGTVTSFLTLAVMVRKTMLASSTCLNFALLAGTDLLVLYFSCLRRLVFILNDQVDVFIQTHGSCRTMDFCIYLSYDLSSWLLVAMTVDRFIAVRYPLKAADVCTPRNAGIAAAVVMVVCVAKNMHFFFTSTVTERNGCLPKKTHQYFRDNVWPWLDASFYCFVPFFLLLVFNILIIHHHHRHRHRAAALSSTTSPAAGTVSFQQRLTTMLLLVSFTFMALTAPRVILICIRQQLFEFISPSGHINFEVVASYALVSAVCSFLQWASHTINFFLYCISGKRFRQELLYMFTHCTHRNHKRTLQAAVAKQHQCQLTPRRDSETTTLSEEIQPQPVQLPTELEDPLSRVSKWAENVLQVNSHPTE